MIRDILMNRSPLAPGDKRPISVNADGDVVVTLRCLRRQPPPRQMVPCGVIVLRPGTVASITPDPVHFPPEALGEIQLELVDQYDGHRIDITIEVAPRDSEVSV